MHTWFRALRLDELLQRAFLALRKLLAVLDAVLFLPVLELVAPVPFVRLAAAVETTAWPIFWNLPLAPR